MKRTLRADLRSRLHVAAMLHVSQLQPAFADAYAVSEEGALAELYYLASDHLLGCAARELLRMLGLPVAARLTTLSSATAKLALIKGGAS